MRSTGLWFPCYVHGGDAADFLPSHARRESGAGSSIQPVRILVRAPDARSRVRGLSDDSGLPPTGFSQVLVICRSLAFAVQLQKQVSPYVISKRVNGIQNPKSKRSTNTPGMQEHIQRRNSLPDLRDKPSGTTLTRVRAGGRRSSLQFPHPLSVHEPGPGVDRQ